MTALFALILNGFRESRRNRVTVVVFLFAFAMIFSATFALEFTVVTFARVITDIGLGVMSLISVFLAIFLSTAMLPREIERRTIFMIMSKPISRSLFVVGRFLGGLLTVTFVTLIMAVLFVGQLLFEGAPIVHAHFAAILGVLLEVVVLSAVGFFFATFASQYVAVSSTVGLYFLGHLARDLYALAERSQVTLVKFFGKLAYYVLPNLERLDFKQRATYFDPTTWGELGMATLYSVGYATLVIALACVLFERRDFK
ncbi:MAG: ABC transporter permease subunit [Archangium sp.]|nr:ABC transporter permease subunit [Archangium sp.]